MLLNVSKLLPQLWKNKQKQTMATGGVDTVNTHV